MANTLVKAHRFTIRAKVHHHLAPQNLTMTKTFYNNNYFRKIFINFINPYLSQINNKIYISKFQEEGLDGCRRWNRREYWELPEKQSLVAMHQICVGPVSCSFSQMPIYMYIRSSTCRHIIPMNSSEICFISTFQNKRATYDVIVENGKLILYIRKVKCSSIIC